MRNQRSRGMISQSNELFAPRSHSSQMSRARPLSQLASLILLTIWVVLISFTTRAQDSAKQQAADSKEVSGFLGGLLRARSRSEEWRLASLREGQGRHEEIQ